MRRLGAFFFWFKFFELNIHYYYYYFFFFFFFFLGGGGVEILIFWGNEDSVDIFGGSGQNWTSFRCLFYVF